MIVRNSRKLFVRNARRLQYRCISNPTQAFNSLTQSPEVIMTYEPTRLERWLSIPTDASVECLEILHFTAGLPWWAAIAGSALCFRMAFFPLLVQQMQQMTRMIQATPDLTALTDRLDKKSKSELSQVSLTREISEIKKKHNIYFRRFWYYPVALVGTFIPFVFAARQIIFRHDYDLQQGGLFWFENLNQPDPYCILPLTCIALTYTVLGLYAGRAYTHEGKIRTMMFRVLFVIQTFEICLIPFVIDMPCGIMIYWGTSAIVGILHKLMIRNAWLCKIFGLPHNQFGGPLQGMTKEAVMAAESKRVINIENPFKKYVTGESKVKRKKERKEN